MFEPLPLSLFNLVVFSLSFFATAMVVRKLVLGEQLVPYVDRPNSDIGGLIGWPVHWWKRKCDDQAPPLNKPSWQIILGDIRIGLGAFLVSFVPVMLLQVLLTKFVKYEHPLILEAQSRFWSVAFMAVVEAPLLEELMFRNFLQGTLEVLERGIVPNEARDSRWSFGVVPIVISSSLFAAAHWDHGAAAAPLFLFALVLGYLYFQTHRLLPCIVAHAALNGFTMVQLWFFVN
jgi:membrane protease YdiL (CAAX protease family)